MRTLALALCAILSLSSFSQTSRVRSNSQLQMLSGEKKTRFNPKNYWDKIYSNQNYVYGKAPDKFLAENFDYIMPGSKVLDIGAGEGRNSSFLAKKGHKVTAIDISSVAMKKARLLAKENGVRINTVTANIFKYDFPSESFDVIVNFYFVNKEVHQKMKRWLKPGGLIIFEAFTLKEKINNPKMKEDKEDSFLKPGELLKLFPGYTVLKYEEPLHQKKYTASAIIKKPE
jgi:tellurite methyltransferase